jgi:hypothetical protein
MARCFKPVFFFAGENKMIKVLRYKQSGEFDKELSIDEFKILCSVIGIDYKRQISKCLSGFYDNKIILPYGFIKIYGEKGDTIE